MKKKSKKAVKEVDVLYQKLGDRWYAISMVNDEVYIGNVPEESIYHSKTTSQNESEDDVESYPQAA